jgi:hypothetical protein
MDKLEPVFTGFSHARRELFSTGAVDNTRGACLVCVRFYRNMLIRVSLIIAIVASLAAAVLGFVKVRERMITTMDQRDHYHQESISERAQKEEAQTQLAETQEELSITQKNLANTERELQTTTARATALEQNVQGLNATLAETRQVRDDALRELNRWEILGFRPEQVRAMIADVAQLREQQEVLAQENRIITLDNTRLKARLDDLIGDRRPPILPSGLRGRIVAVDPKYDFVILDLGINDGLVERGELLVNREGRMVAKLRVTAVEPNLSIANIMPGWRDGELNEGDVVIPAIGL